MTRILVVDDDPLVCEVISEGLREKIKADVQCASTAAIGARMIRFTRFDLVLVDALMQGGNGFALAELAANENVPVLLTSGHPDAQAKLQRFGYPYLAKPFSLRILGLQAGLILGEARENVRNVKASAARLHASVEALGVAMAESRRLVMQSRAIL